MTVLDIAALALLGWLTICGCIMLALLWPRDSGW